MKKRGLDERTRCARYNACMLKRKPLITLFATKTAASGALVSSGTAPRRQCGHGAVGLLISLCMCWSSAWAQIESSTPAGQEAPATTSDSVPLVVRLEAPSEVLPVLEQHLRLLTRKQVYPSGRGDRLTLVRRTRREATDLLATEGYFSPTIEIQRDEANWTVVVKPGPQAKVAAVTLDFVGHIRDAQDQMARREALERAWGLKPGDGFKQSEWDAAKQALLDEVSSHLYAAARIVDSKARVNPETAEVELSLTLDSGPPFYLGQLEISGRDRLPEGWVERFSQLEEGEPFDQGRLLAFQSVLQNVPQFASVVVDVERDPVLAPAVPVRVRVSEANSRHLSLGAGFSTNTGARTEFNWRDVNFRDKGWELSTGVRLEQLRQSLYADVILPPAYPPARHRDSFGALLDRSDIEGVKSTVQALGMTRVRPRGDIETALGIRFLSEDLRPAGLPSTSLKAMTVNWSWVQRKVDNVLDPREGYVLHGEIGGGSKAFLSDQDFIRTYVRAVRYQPIGKMDVLILRGELGVTIADSRKGIPQDFLFRTGGTQSVRGYDFNSLGVKEGDATLGGRYMSTLSAEYVHWFKPQWGVASFVDIGDASDGRSDFDAKLGYGLGARWRSPAGPLAVDVAYGHHDERVRIHFALGIAF